MDSSFDWIGILSARVVGNIGAVSRKEESVGKDTTVAVDLAKSVFEIAVSARPGRVSARHRLSRAQLLRFFAQQPAATVLLEACGTAHFWAREIARSSGWGIPTSVSKAKLPERRSSTCRRLRR